MYSQHFCTTVFRHLPRLGQYLTDSVRLPDLQHWSTLETQIFVLSPSTHSKGFAGLEATHFSDTIEHSMKLVVQTFRLLGHLKAFGLAQAF